MSQVLEMWWFIVLMGTALPFATSLLHRHDFSRMKDLVGGFDAWEQVVVTPAIQSADALHHVGGR